MSLSLQQISDRLEIEQLIVEYSNAIDRRDFDALDRVFTPDAYIDYRALGGIDGRYPEVKAWLGPALGKFPSYSHMVGNITVKVTGDEAAARTLCFNPMVIDLGESGQDVMFIGLWYVDKLVRTSEGWRMAERVEEKCYTHNVPGAMNVG